MRSAITTWSELGTRCTLRSSANSLARFMSALAKKLCPLFLLRSPKIIGCSENLAPHANTVATKLEVTVSIGNQGYQGGISGVRIMQWLVIPGCTIIAAGKWGTLRRIASSLIDVTRRL